VRSLTAYQRPSFSKTLNVCDTPPCAGISTAAPSALDCHWRPSQKRHLLVSAAPLARVEHPLLLPTPWVQLTPWLPHGAALDAARQIAWFDGAGTPRPVLVLIAWLAVSCVVLAVSRRERRRAGVDPRSVATAR
jgi:hypothetical protein